jgi:Periplasmic serine proteases (ClpP class)
VERIKSEQLVESFLSKLNDDLGDALGDETDVVAIFTPMAQPWDDVLRLAIEDLAGCHEQEGGGGRRLAVVLETNGGYIETVERMVRAMRQHYQDVLFIIPNYAYSAGTVLALSGDDILMDYHSILGPIDPQYSSGNGEAVPGMGYLAKYNELVQTINAAPDASRVRAEISYLIEKFDPGKLFHIEQAIEHSKSLLREWLPKYKFKNWTHRSQTGQPVTPQDRQARADQVAHVLGDAHRWHSHGRGITCDDLESEEIKLKITNYGANPELKRHIRNYRDLLVDYMGKKSWHAALHTKLGFKTT